MNPLRTLSILGLITAALTAHAQSFADSFGTADPGVTLTAPNSSGGNAVTIAPGLTRRLSLTQNANPSPGVLSSSIAVFGNQLGLDQDPQVVSNFGVDYTYATATSLLGTTAFQVNVRASDFAYTLRATVTDALGAQAIYSGTVPAYSNPASPLAALLTPFAGSANLALVKTISFQSSGVPASTDSSFSGFSSVANPTPEPSALAALGVGAVALLKRRKRV